jgi:3-deoxy-D-manno-octulosonate 8-phosphate phosphatase (KDO 8-P phosphatase)
MNLHDRARKIKLLIMDCDGVLTDGRLYFSSSGEEMKVFYVRDGQGIVDWHRAGFLTGVISGRNSPIVDIRFQQLGVKFIVQNCEDKVTAFNEMLLAAGVTAAEAAFIGDDIVDVPVLGLAGLGVAVADAHKTAKAAAAFITDANGGQGAVRELIDLMLAAKE